MKQTAATVRSRAFSDWRARSYCRCHLVTISAVCLALWTEPSFPGRTGWREDHENLVAALSDTNTGPALVETVQDAATVLELKSPVERELLHGQIHSYHIQVERGQYLRVTIERWGAELKLTLARLWAHVLRMRFIRIQVIRRSRSCNSNVEAHRPR